MWKFLQYKNHWGKHPGVRDSKDLTRGEYAADIVRHSMGSWSFVFGFLILMGFWALVNTLVFGGVIHSRPFDPYPFILLNLMLSTMAGLQAAILLIAARRADQIAAEQALHHLELSEEIKRLLEQNTQLTTQVKNDTVLLKELHRHIEALSKKFGVQAGAFSAEEDLPNA